MSRRPRPGDPDRLLDHRDALRKLALALEPHAADDLVQDTWERALRRPPQDDVPADRWLLGVLRNVWRMRRRSDARRRRREEWGDVYGDGVPAPDEALDDHRRLAQLEQRIDELPPSLRSVVRLRYFDGLSAAEIARRTDVPAGTIRRRLKEGLDRLRADSSAPGTGAMLLATADLHARPSGLATQVLAMKAATKLAIGGLAVSLLVAGAVAGSQSEPPAQAVTDPPSDLAEHAAPPPSTPSPVAAIATVPTGPRADPPARRLTEAQRAARARRDQVLEGILRIRDKRDDWPQYPGPSADGDLAPDYIRDRIQSDLIPAARSCYNQMLLRDPDYEGKIVVDFTLVADENLGGVVENVDLVEGTDIDNEQMRECLRDAMYSVVFDPPEDGGSVRVNYAIDFEPD